jgi:uncharacterized protein
MAPTENQPSAGPASGSPDGSASAVVTLRPIASGLPFGFFGLALAAALIGAQAYGYLPASASRVIGLLLLPTAMLQFIAGIFCVLGRDVMPASLMLTLSGIWLGTALVYLSHPAHGLPALGIWYLALAPVLMALISSGTGKLALGIVPTVALPVFVVTAVWLLGNAGSAGLGKATAVLTFLLAAVGLYAGLSLLLEDSRRRTILPTLRRGPHRQAIVGTFSDQLTNVGHEAGVRRYL